MKRTVKFDLSIIINYIVKICFVELSITSNFVFLLNDCLMYYYHSLTYAYTTLFYGNIVFVIMHSKQQYLFQRTLIYTYMSFYQCTLTNRYMFCYFNALQYTAIYVLVLHADLQYYFICYVLVLMPIYCLTS